MRARASGYRETKKSAASTSVVHHGEKESDRERTWKGDSLLFHFISAFFCSNLVGRMTRMSAAERVRGAKERKRRERAATTRIAGDRVWGERDAAGRNRSMSRLHGRTRTESTVRRTGTGPKRDS